MLWKLLRETKASEAPTHIAVIFDASAKTFRNDIYEDYKAHRPPAPEELVPQFPLIRDAVKAFNVACIEQDGYEADDLIATYARQVVDAGGDVTIVSSDKDLMQLVRPGVAMFDAMKAKKIGRDEVIEKFGVPPDKVVDVQSLAGDFDRQRAGRAGHRRQDGGRADQRIRRSRRAAGARRRDQAAEAPREADRVRRAGAHLARAGAARRTTCRDRSPPTQLGVQRPEAAMLLGFLREMEFSTLTRRIAEALGAEPPPPVAVSVGSSVSRRADRACSVGAAGAEHAATARGRDARCWRVADVAAHARESADRPLEI